jgi:hypothetical protein
LRFLYESAGNGSIFDGSICRRRLSIYCSLESQPLDNSGILVSLYSRSEMTISDALVYSEKRQVYSAALLAVLSIERLKLKEKTALKLWYASFEIWCNHPY